MQDSGATRGTQFIATFQGGNHTPACILCSHLDDFARYPVIIAVRQVELTHAILEMLIKPGRHQDDFRPEAAQCRQQWFLYRLLEAVTAGTGIGRGRNNVTAIRDQRGAGIIRVLEYRAQHDALIGLEYAFGAIAVVDIEIDNRDPVKACGQGMGCTYRGVVEDAEPHRAVSPRMVPRRPDAAEYCVRLVVHHHINALQQGTGDASSRESRSIKPAETGASSMA
jgi:hypothetical protein